MRGRFQHLVDRIGVLRQPCDLDLLLFFCRHPRTLLTSERLAAYIGYELNEVARSLDILTDGGLIERSQNPTQPARMYSLKTGSPQDESLSSLLQIASTLEGRRRLIKALIQRAPPRESGDDRGKKKNQSEVAWRPIKGREAAHG